MNGSNHGAGHLTHTEIFSQPRVWESAIQQFEKEAASLQQFISSANFQSIIFTGCGSTHYLSLAAAALTQELTGIHARGIPASEIWLYPRSAYLAGENTLLVAVSRSGETTETIRAVDAFHQHGKGKVITLSCYPDCPLPQMGDLNLVYEMGQEESVVQTRAFSVLYLASIAVALAASKQQHLLKDLHVLSAICERLLNQYGALAAKYGQNAHLDRFYFLGSGPRYGLAAELSLKMKEMSLSHSEPFHFMEFRHGPQSMANDQALMIGLLSESNRQHEEAVLREMAARGATIMAIAEHDADVVFNSGVPELLRNVLYLPVGQMLGYERSLWRGLNPDRPNNLEAVVRLDTD